MNARLKQYPKGTFHIDGGVFYCSFCNISVSWEKKDTTDKHLKSKKHLLSQERSGSKCQEDPPAKRLCQMSIDGTIGRMNEAKEARTNTVFKIVESFTAANIPMEKLDNPSLRKFIQTEVKGGGSIPKANTLRDEWIPRVFFLQKEELRKSLASKKVALILDEAEDACERQVNI